MKRTLSALLALLMLVPAIAACSNDDAAETTAETTAADTAAEETTELQSIIPEDLDFDGMEIRILHGGDPMMSADDPGDIVESAILDWQREISEKLNVSFKILPSITDAEMLKSLPLTLLSGTDDYDLIFGYSWILAKYVAGGYYHNLQALDYANFDEKHWSTLWMEEAAIGTDRRYMAAGDISISLLKSQTAYLYNKNVYESYFGNPDELYTVVDDGAWTFDYMTEKIASVYRDLNGNNEKDIDDQFGIILNLAGNTDHLTYTQGFKATKRDSDGIPVLEIVNEKNNTIIERLYNLIYNNGGTHWVPNADAAKTGNTVIPEKFQNDELLFVLGFLSNAELYRDMEGDFGIIPAPKYDESQENYTALVHDAARAVVIPASVSFDTAHKLSAVMEEMAFLSWRDITPTYYETALKVKYVRDSDDLSIKIIDIIHDNAYTDFAYIYNYAIEGAGLIMRQLMVNASTDLASQYASMEAKTTAAFNDLIDQYMAIE